MAYQQTMTDSVCKTYPHVSGTKANFYYDGATAKRTARSQLPPDSFAALIVEHDKAHPGDQGKPLYAQKLHSMSVDDVWTTYSQKAGLGK